ncbi:MAG: hypothetical protein IIA51_08280 [Chloroflexi bacterium]|nr:hypothetical protein [Chloroflexota bacterium]
MTLTMLSLTLALALVVGLAGFTHFTFEFLMRPITDRAVQPIGLFGGLSAVLIGALSGSLSAHNMLRRRRHVDELQAEGH